MAVVLLAGCALVGSNKEKLTTSLRQYNMAMRWGAVEYAAEHVDPAKRSELLARRKEFGELQVSEYEVGAVKLKGKDTALAMVRIDWYLANSLSVRTSYVEQVWKLKGGKWLITDQRLVRGAPYPLMMDKDRRRYQEQDWPEA